MGYQVGNHCYLDKELAEKVYFSQVPPVITNDGVKQIVFQNNQFYYGSQKLEARLPECNPVENFQLGFELMMYLVPTAILLFTARIIIRLMD